MIDPSRISTAHREDAVLVVVDVQERLFPLMQERDVLAARIRALMEGADLLGVPILVTEQYKKGLGPTLPELLDAAPARMVEKTTFSCFGDEDFLRVLRETERRQVIVCGIEAHICVLQTCLAARAEGYDTFVVADAVGTRLPHTKSLGLERLRDAGVVTTTVESALFEMMERCDTDAFKSLLPVIKELA